MLIEEVKGLNEPDPAVNGGHQGGFRSAFAAETVALAKEAKISVPPSHHYGVWLRRRFEDGINKYQNDKSEFLNFTLSFLTLIF